MVDAEEEIGPGHFPAGIALTFREPEQFEIMTIRVAELDGFDTSCSNVRYWNRLGAWRDLPDMVLPQLRPSHVHVADDDGDVLEPEIVTVGGHGNRPHIRRRQKLDQLKLLLTKLHPDHSRPHTEDSPELIVFRPIDFHIADWFEGQHIRIERDGAVHIRHCHPDGLNRQDHTSVVGKEGCGSSPEDDRNGQPEADEQPSCVHSLISLAPERHRLKQTWLASPAYLPSATREVAERS